MPAKKSHSQSSGQAAGNSSQFRLYRSETNKVLGGVCGGIAEAFDVDSTIIRLIFVLLFVFGGSGFLLYLILWVVIPSKSHGLTSEESIRRGADEIRSKAHEFAGKLRTKDNDRKSWLGLIVLLFGVAFLFNNFGFNLRIGEFWPILLIIFGLLMISKRNG